MWRSRGSAAILTRLAGQAEYAVLQDMGVVRQRQGAIDILLDNNERHARLLQDHKGLVQPVHHDWRETRG